MADFNSDKERHVDHTFVVQKAWPNSPDSVMTSKGELKGNGQGRFTVKDETLAREIQKAYPRDFAVTRMRTPKPADAGHRYHFGSMKPMPWAKYDELGRRIRDDKQEVTDGSDKRTEGSNNGGNGAGIGDGEGQRTTDGEGATG